MEIRKTKISEISDIEYFETADFFSETAKQIENYRPEDK